VEAVAERDGAAVVPAVAVALDGRVRLALERARQRLLLGGRVVVDAGVGDEAGDGDEDDERGEALDFLLAH
jgi:hypothetical protein